MSGVYLSFCYKKLLSNIKNAHKFYTNYILKSK